MTLQQQRLTKRFQSLISAAQRSVFPCFAFQEVISLASHQRTGSLGIIMHLKSSFLLLFASVLLCLAAVESPVGVLKPRSYRILHPSGTLGTDYGPAYAINNAGQVVGGANRPGTDGYEAYVFDVKRGARFLPKIPGARHTDATAINSRGEIMGSTHTNDYATTLFWSRTGELTVLVPPPGWRNANGVSLNDRGQICGALQNPGGVIAGFIWDAANGFQVISNYGVVMGLNRWGTFVGGVPGGLDLVLVPGDGGASTALPQEFRTVPNRILRTEVLVGWSASDNGVQAQVFSARAGLQPLPRLYDLPSNDNAFSVNRRGLIVGDSHDAAVLWKDGRVYNLNAVRPADTEWLHLSSARDINDKGWIVGVASRSDRLNATSFLLIPREQD